MLFTGLRWVIAFLRLLLFMFTLLLGLLIRLLYLGNTLTDLQFTPYSHFGYSISSLSNVYISLWLLCIYFLLILFLLACILFLLLYEFDGIGVANEGKEHQESQNQLLGHVWWDSRKDNLYSKTVFEIVLSSLNI